MGEGGGMPLPQVGRRRSALFQWIPPQCARCVRESASGGAAVRRAACVKKHLSLRFSSLFSYRYHTVFPLYRIVITRH